MGLHKAFFHAAYQDNNSHPLALSQFLAQREPRGNYVRPNPCNPILVSCLLNNIHHHLLFSNTIVFSMRTAVQCGLHRVKFIADDSYQVIFRHQQECVCLILVHVLQTASTFFSASSSVLRISHQFWFNLFSRLQVPVHRNSATQ